MPHNRGASQGKLAKKAGKKKTSSPTTSPVGDAGTGSPEKTAQNSLPDSGDADFRPRAKTQGAASIAAQILSQSPTRGENNPSTRRRANTRTSISGNSQAPSAVFQFLDEDNAASNEEGSNSKKKNSSSKTRSAPKDRQRKTSLTQSFHSDSGVSVREHSPDRASSVGSRDSADYQPLTPPDVSFDAVDWKRAAGSKLRFPMAGAYLTDTETIADSPASQSLVDLSVPESYYHHQQQQQQQQQQLPAPEPVVPAMGKTNRPKIDTSALKPKDKPRLTNSTSPPADTHTSSPKSETRSGPRLYRQFGDLNHRLICHIQEEITQMEDDLATLDELEEMHHSSSDSQTSPRQKMLAAKFNDLHITDWSVLHDKRSELMEKLVVKTEKYNRTLCAYSKTIKNLHPASERDVESYRAAAQGRMTKSDRSLLAHDTDLLLLDPNHSRHLPNPLYPTVAAIFAAVLLPLLAFGAISEFFGRIVVVTFTAAAIAFWASHGPPGNEYMIAPQNVWQYSALYFGFMFFAAMVIP